MTLNKKSNFSKTAEVIFMLLIVLFFIAIIASIVRTNTGGAPKADNGVLYLSDWDFDTQGTVMLSGKWAFYWEKFAAPGDDTAPDLYAKVPDVWNNYGVGGKGLSAYGYATYILRVEDVHSEQLAIRVPPCSTAYQLYIDGKLLAQNGTVARTAEGFVPEYEPESITFSPQGHSFTITILVANYVYARGGVWYPTILGTPSQIEKLDRHIVHEDWFLIGSFITISLFCFCIFFVAKRDLPILLFAVLALVTALRTTLYGSYILSSLVPFRMVVITDYMTLVWMSALIALFLMKLADKEKLRKLTPAILTTAGLLSVFIVSSPVHVFTRFTSLIELYAFALALYALFRMLKSANRSKAAIFLGTMVFIFCGIYDVLYQKCILMGSSELSPVGFFIMLGTWGIVLAKDYTDLNEYARASEEKAHAAEIAFLQAQIKPHFLYNTLNVISALCRLDGEYAEKLTLDLSKYLQYSFEFKNLSRFISFSAELEFIETYVKIEKARFINEFDVIYDLCDTSELIVPPLSIQPLIENAIRHGVRKKEAFGTVLLSVRDEENRFIIEVSDDGVGIEPSRLDKLNRGIRDENSGGGLTNVKQRIESLRGASFLIESKLGCGTRIIVTIPKNIRALNDESLKTSEPLF